MNGVTSEDEVPRGKPHKQAQLAWSMTRREEDDNGAVAEQVNIQPGDLVPVERSRRIEIGKPKEACSDSSGPVGELHLSLACVELCLWEQVQTTRMVEVGV